MGNCPMHDFLKEPTQSCKLACEVAMFSNSGASKQGLVMHTSLETL